MSSASETRQRALSVPWVCWEIPIPQKISAAFARPKTLATSRIVSAGTPQIFSDASGVYLRTTSRSASNPSVCFRMYS